MWKRSNVLSKPVLMVRSASTACVPDHTRYTLRKEQSIDTTTKPPPLSFTPTVRSAAFAGDDSGGVPPDPIPNSEVKPSYADGTAGATQWESRSSPAPSRPRGRVQSWIPPGFFLFLATHPAARSRCDAEERALQPVGVERLWQAARSGSRLQRGAVTVASFRWPTSSHPVERGSVRLAPSAPPRPRPVLQGVRGSPGPAR